MRGRRGFTLIETCIAMTLGAAVLTVAFEALASVNEGARASTRALLASSRSDEVVSVLAGELRNASRGTISIPSEGTIRFRPVLGYRSQASDTTLLGVVVGTVLGGTSPNEPGVVLGDLTELSFDPDRILRRRVSSSSTGLVTETVELARSLANVSFTWRADGRVVVFVAYPLATGDSDVAPVGSRGVVVAVAARNA